MTDKETIKDYITFFSANLKKDVYGKFRIDSPLIRKLVVDDPETSAVVVELYCKMGKKDPMYFQLASVIARAYQDVFDDDVLMIIIKNAQNKSGSKPAPPLDSESGNGKNL